MKKTVKFLMSLLVGLLIAPMTANAQTNKVINQENGVVIGFDDTFAPFGFKNEAGEHVGFDLDLAAEILGQMNVEYTFQPIDWSMKETELNTGNIDMIWNGYSITPERQDVVLFSDPYIENRQIIIVPTDSEIESKADLAGKVLATQEQSASLEAILSDEEFVTTLGSEPVTYATFVEVFSDLNNKRVDAIVVDETLASYFLEQNDSASDYRTLEENFGEEEYGVGFRKSDDAFLEEFNKTLAKIIEDGKFDEIKAKWFTVIEAEEE